MATASDLQEEAALGGGPALVGQRVWPAAAILLAAIVLGASAAAAAMPWLFRHVPTDLSRIGVLLDALHHPTQAPRMVVLGNSVVMYGIDARQLSAELPTRPLAFNLASTGQSLAESLLFTQELPSSVRQVVLVVGHRELILEGEPDPQKYNAFYMFGFRPSPDVEHAWIAAFGAPARALLAESDLEQRFRARLVVRQLFDMGLRRLLRPDLALDHATRDLFFPHAGATRWPDAKIERALRIWIETGRELPSGLASAKKVLLDAVLEETRRRSASLVLVLPPMQPALLEADAAALASVRGALVQLAHEEGFSFVDLSALLPPDDFIDHLHPTQAGARRFTSAVASFLAGRG